MKKIIAILATMLIAGTVAFAQPRTAGIRLGYGLDLTYQHSLGQNNMLTADLSLPWSFNGVGATATYDWINPFNATIPWSYYGNWNWYMGVGGNLGMGGNSSSRTEAGITYKNSYFDFSFGAAGRVGVEYEFEFPLTLAVEYTPVLGPAFGSSTEKVYAEGTPTVTNTSSTAGFGFSGLYRVGIAVRYRF